MRFPLSSVRLRLALGALATISAALVISWFGLVALFERHVERRIGSELNLHLSQIAARTLVSADGQLSLEREPSDPRFERVHSGLYWQVQDETTGNLLRSRSLWDERLSLPADKPALGVPDIHDIAGPRGAFLHVHERRLILPVGEAERVVRFVVAIDRAEIDALTAGFADDARLALLGLGLVLVVASIVQIVMGVAPLAGIERQVASVRNGSTRRLAQTSAEEVRPLVNEVNALLDMVDSQIARARARAADLAHALKTPLSALKADAARLSAKGDVVIGADIDAAVNAMSAQVERELARTRVRHGARSTGTRFKPVADGLANVIRRTPAGETIVIDIAVADSVAVSVDETDLAEIMGNLIENAVRHAGGVVRVCAEALAEGSVRIVVDDDGPGLDEVQRTDMMKRGERLDTGSAGAGLGLSIVAELLEAYGTELVLGVSPDGGLRASFVVGAARVGA